jgi:D-inositol-3-phosphate glycosyltransferase
MHIREQLGISGTEVMILYVGALVPMKGPDVFLRALRDLVAEEPRYRNRVRTIVVGGSELWRMRGPVTEADEYEAELKSLGKAAGARFVGLLPHHETLRLQHACDIVVIPSIAVESHPLVVCEAMAAGKPVIASDVGGISETVIDGRTGLLVPAGNQKALASAIRSLVDDGDLRHRMGQAGRERARLFTWDGAAVRLDEIYGALLEAKAKA